jgi:hypothetical protein
MSEWTLVDKNLKNYPHFDPDITASQAVTLAMCPKSVETHTFYPLMLYHQRWNRFAPKGGNGVPKERPIRYAARRDAYIFSRYRHLLAGPYDTELKEAGLSDAILAYRRIIDPATGKGKCNIDFARDAFLKIKTMGDCCVVALDISSYFENLEHDRIKELWGRLIGEDRLPPDHYRVYEAITRYSVVDKESVYRRLGFFGPKSVSKSGKIIDGYLMPYPDIPKKLCSGYEFRQKIAGGDGQKSIIKQNYKTRGVPQGAPISDLLANLYLLDFDKIVAQWMRDAGGTYYRYSDDILLIAPGGHTEGLTWKEKAQDLILSFGKDLKIKDKKSSVFTFHCDGTKQNCTLAYGDSGKNGLEYLGFRYNGQSAYIRNSTMSNLYRKVASAARRDSNAIARRYPNKSVAELEGLFNYERLIKKFGKVEDFDEKQDDYRSWTFWTYASRAAVGFGQLGTPIKNQLKRYKQIVRHRVSLELVRAVERREGRGKTV